MLFGRVYLHAPYYINLCRPRNKRSQDEGEKGSWTLNRLIDEIELAKKMGFLGVVVHSGKAVGMKRKKALRIMIKSLRKVISHATPECPLLLETPAGQGNELCFKRDRFRDLCYEIIGSIPEPMAFGICIDTCHVFAAGYDPFAYMADIADQVGLGMIRLIHLNGSMIEKGSRVDRHYSVSAGAGYIPMENINSVMCLSQNSGIPMVVE